MPLLNIQLEGFEEFKTALAQGKGNVQKEVRWAMVQSVNLVKNSAQDNAPYKTGTLRRSIFTDVSRDGFTGTVAQDGKIAPYGIFLEYGTRAHVINPVNKKALFWKGALNPYKRIMHPGFAARPYFFPAITANVENVQKYFEEAMRRVIQSVA